MSIYEIGVSFWALFALVLIGSAFVAALVASTFRQIQQSLGHHVERFREHASAALHEPLPSSPSHPSFPPPL